MCLPEHLLWYPLLGFCVYDSAPQAHLQAPRQSESGPFPEYLYLEVGGRLGPVYLTRGISHCGAARER